MTIRHNTIFNSHDQTDAISLFQDFGNQANRTIDDNLVAGGGYSVYGGGGCADVVQHPDRQQPILPACTTRTAASSGPVAAFQTGGHGERLVRQRLGRHRTAGQAVAEPSPPAMRTTSARSRRVGRARSAQLWPSANARRAAALLRRSVVDRSRRTGPPRRTPSACPPVRSTGCPATASPAAEVDTTRQTGGRYSSVFIGKLQRLNSDSPYGHRVRRPSVARYGGSASNGSGRRRSRSGARRGRRNGPARTPDPSGPMMSERHPARRRRPRAGQVGAGVQVTDEARQWVAGAGHRPGSEGRRLGRTRCRSRSGGRSRPRRDRASAATASSFTATTTSAERARRSSAAASRSALAPQNSAAPAGSSCHQ